MGSDDDVIPVNDAAHRATLIRKRLAKLATQDRDPLFLPFDAMDLPSPAEDPRGDVLTEVRSALHQVLGFADAAAVEAGFPNGLIGTRAFHLLLALDRDLAALARGANAPALAPRSPTSASQTRSLHETINQFKDETAAAAEFLFRWEAPREKVWSSIATVVAGAGYPDWGAASIKKRHKSLRDHGSLDAAVSRLLLVLLRGGRVDEGPEDWSPVVGPDAWDSRMAARKIEERLEFMAGRAAAMLAAVDQARKPKA